MPPAVSSWVSSPLTTEHSPARLLPPATLVAFRAGLAGRIAVDRTEHALHGSRQRARVGARRRRRCRRVRAQRRRRRQRPAQDRLQARRSGSGSARRSRCCRCPMAVGFPLASSDADALPHSTSTFNRARVDGPGAVVGAGRGRRRAVTVGHGVLGAVERVRPRATTWRWSGRGSTLPRSRGRPRCPKPRPWGRCSRRLPSRRRRAAAC